MGLLRMDPTLKKTINLYSSNKLLRLFAWLRSFHADYEGIEEHIPKSGVVIDVGCGHGMFANYLGLKSPSRRVYGLEVNDRKLKNAPRGVANVLFSKQPLESFEKNSASAIIFYHVLHHLDGFKQQEKLLTIALQILKPDGRLVIIEIEKKPFWKFIICWLVDHTLYPGDRIYFRFKESMLKLLNELRLSVNYFMCDSKAPLPHIAYIASKRLV